MTYSEITKRVNVQKFLACNPTLIGIMSGVRFYECPVNGDEGFLTAICGESGGQTHWLEMPDCQEYALSIREALATC
jgi:hypothetical protein